MGWSYGWESSAAVRDHLREQLRGAGYVIVRDALTAYGRHYYAAVRYEKPGGDAARLGQTSIFVALLNGSTRRDRFGDADPHAWGYKDMAESMGPCEVDCPLAVLEAADPAESLYTGDSLEWAAGWRARVRAFHAARAAASTLNTGDRVWVRHSDPAANPYTVQGRQKRRVYCTRADRPGQFYWLPTADRIERIERAGEVHP